VLWPSQGMPSGVGLWAFGRFSSGSLNPQRLASSEESRMVVPAPQFVKFRLTFSSCGGAITLARVGILNDRCREMAKMLDLQAGRGCCLIFV
jgi:hypothetical protein